MMRLLWIAVITVTLLGCASPPTGSSSAPGQTRRTGRAEPRRLIAAIRGAPISIPHLWPHPATGSVPGLDAVQELMGAGAVHKNDKSVVLPQLAEAVPSVDNGLWTVFPDGRMETT